MSNSFSAIVPLAHMASANDALELLGFGANNFSVPAYDNKSATHGMFSAWFDQAFYDAVVALPNVTILENATDPITMTTQLALDVGATYGANAPEYPINGLVEAGKLYQLDGQLWGCIQSYSTTTYPLPPSTYPALIRYVRNPNVVEAYHQPLDQYDAYYLVNAFTGTPDRCTYNGKTWQTLINANVFVPVEGQQWTAVTTS